MQTAAVTVEISIALQKGRTGSTQLPNCITPGSVPKEREGRRLFILYEWCSNCEFLAFESNIAQFTSFKKLLKLKKCPGKGKVSFASFR